MKIRFGLGRLVLAVVAVLSLSLYPCLGGTIRHDKTYTAYDAAMASQYPIHSIGKMTWNYGYGSATYLGNGWVLTAAHLADITNSYTFTINGSSYQSSQIYLHWSWDDEVTHGNDIALIKLNTTEVYAEPVRLYNGTPNSLMNNTVTLAGYGKTGTGLTGATGGGGILHAGQNKIEGQGLHNFFIKYPDSILFYDFDNPNQPDAYNWSANTPLDYEYLITPGDSGGGAFIWNSDHFEQVGIHSFMVAPQPANGGDGVTDGTYTDVGAMTAVSAFSTFLMVTAGTNFTGDSGPALYYPGDFNSDYVVDAVDLALLLDNWGATDQPTMWTSNWDDFVDADELSALLANWGVGLGAGVSLAAPMIDLATLETSATIPEPASILLIGLGGLMMMRRR